MATHVRVLSVLFALFGIFGIFAAVSSTMILGTLAALVGLSGEDGAPLGSAVLGLTGIALTGILIALSLPAILAAYGLWHFRPWGRILAIIMAVLALIQFPLGTVFGAYALFVLFKQDGEALFRQR